MSLIFEILQIKRRCRYLCHHSWTDATWYLPNYI